MKWKNTLMSKGPPRPNESKPPAMGERHTRWGLGYQDKVATERILVILREELRLEKRDFEGIRLADLEAGRVDDFVLVWNDKVEGNSIKWSSKSTLYNWGTLIGNQGLLKELADGYQRLKERWPEKEISVRLQSNILPSAEQHPSQIISSYSVDDFFREHWPYGPTSDDSAEVKNAWKKISDHVGLSSSEFKEFVGCCKMVFGYPQPPSSGPDSRDWRSYKKQFDELHKAIATWITNNPDDEIIERQILLSALGIRGGAFSLIQYFPAPEIPYARNNRAADQLSELIKNTEGGYIAVTGLAGVGKSTLVKDVLFEGKYPFFIPYFAFLPDSDGNRDRGESLTFFQDVVGRLDRFYSHRYSVGIEDVSQGREALRQHMSKAHEQYLASVHPETLTY